MYRKLYAYAYPTSKRAVDLGYAKTGCYYIGRETRRKDGSYSPNEVWPGTESDAAAHWKDCGSLRARYDEIEAPVSPYCGSHIWKTRGVRG